MVDESIDIEKNEHITLHDMLKVSERLLLMIFDNLQDSLLKTRIGNFLKGK